MPGPTTLSDLEAPAFEMRETTPSVHLIARPAVDLDGMRGRAKIVPVRMKSTSATLINDFAMTTLAAASGPATPRRVTR